MPLALLPMTESDLPIYGSIAQTAFGAQPVSFAMLPKRHTPAFMAHVLGRDTRDFLHKRNFHWLKVVDTDTDEMIACAKWRLEDDGTHDEEVKKEPWFEEANGEAKDAFLGGIEKARVEVMGRQDYWREFIIPLVLV